MTSYDEPCSSEIFIGRNVAGELPMYVGERKESKSSSLRLKRAFDIFNSLLGIIFFGPLMIIIYVILRFTCGEPIFLHRRVGQNGVPFYCYKFRSMVRNADQVLIDYLDNNPAAAEEWSKTFKLKHDPRITWCGSFLRLTSLDELPQFFNVLKGEMSLVGPRPIVHAEIELYSDKIAEYYSCKPGITGLWQVSGRNLVTYERRVELDSIYANKRSLPFDLYIIAQTVLVVLSRKGAS